MVLASQGKLVIRVHLLVNCSGVLYHAPEKNGAKEIKESPSQEFNEFLDLKILISQTKNLLFWYYTRSKPLIGPGFAFFHQVLTRKGKNPSGVSQPGDVSYQGASTG